MSMEAKPLFLGGHPALDFLNTTFTPPGAVVDVIGSGDAFVAWLVEAGHLDAASAAKLKRRESAKTLEAVATEARKTRDWAAGWIARWRAAPSGDYESERRRLNSLLARAQNYREIVPTEEGWTLAERTHLGAAAELIALIDAPIARLVTNESPDLIRRCAGTECSLWFLDRTKAHRRVFCSAAACGNRAKVAAFRERQRAQ
jgi:predicted RNA-binding Zn ribbon-like protein